jgi:hypothetical protein
VPTTCPSCRSPLVDGVLRCRDCGADARGAPRSVGVAVRLDGLLSEETIQALDTFEQLRAAAPGVAEWYRTTDDAGRRLVEELLAELRRLRRPNG